MLKHVLCLIICLAACASMTAAASLSFVEDWEDDTAGGSPGSPWYDDPHMSNGSLTVIAGEAYNHTWIPGLGYGNNGLLVNDAGFNGKNAGIQARLVPAGQWVEATDANPLTMGYFVKSTAAKRADWYLEISLGDIHAPRLADVGTYNPLPAPIPVLAYCKPLLDPDGTSRATYFFDGRQWMPHGFVDIDNVWANPHMTVSLSTVHLVCTCNNNPADVPRAYLGSFDRVSVYTLDNLYSLSTFVDDLSVTGGNIVHMLSVAPNDNLTSEGPMGGPFSPQCKAYTLTNVGASPLNWSATKSQDWLSVAPATGTLAAGGSVNVDVCFTVAANQLPLGPHTAEVAFADTGNNDVQNRSVQLSVGRVDAFTELFVANNDLHHRSLTFTPNGTAHYYQVCGDPATAFPVNPTGGTAVTLSGDSYQKVTLAQGAQVRLYGQAYSEFYIGSNGYITFGSGDTNAIESLASHFNRPRISALFTDLYPSEGQISWRQMMDRAVVTCENVTETGTPGGNSFQVEMFYDGRIRMTWLGLSAADGLAGLSRGNGTPPDYLASDLSGYAACPAGHHAADFDGDGDVDLADFGQIQACLVGHRVLVIQPSCGDTDLDTDGDADQVDMGLFLPCLTGPELPIPANCFVP